MFRASYSKEVIRHLDMGLVSGGYSTEGVTRGRCTSRNNLYEIATSALSTWVSLALYSIFISRVDIRLLVCI